MHANLLTFLGGVPRQIVCDQSEGRITRACFYEPLVNRTYADLAAYYGTAIIPARPVQGARQGEGRGRRAGGAAPGSSRGCATVWFFSLCELNAAIRELTAQLNDRALRGWGTTRRILFEQIDRPALLPLPPAPGIRIC